MQTTIQQIDINYEHSTFSVLTERHVHAAETRWSLINRGVVTLTSRWYPDRLQATEAGLNAILDRQGLSVKGARLMVSCEMLSCSEAEAVLAERLGGLDIEEY